VKGAYLGELEELILLMIGVLYPEAYGVSVMDELKKQADRSLNISAVHAVLNRLESKGYVKSHMSQPTEERGGRSKRIFTMTAEGKTVLEENQALRNQLYAMIPKPAFQFNLGY